MFVHLFTEGDRSSRREFAFPVYESFLKAVTSTILHMKRLNQTESPIFVILCVLCFQRQSLRKQAYSNIKKVSRPKTENFQIKKKMIFFIFLLKT